MASAELGSDADAVFRQVCGLMADRRLQPGDRLPSIRDLARRFGSNVVAVRDALVRADRERIVELRARSGAFVRAQSPPGAAAARHDFSLRVVDGQQLHLCHVRELLEVEAAGQAAERCRPADLLPIREALEQWLRGHAEGDGPVALEADHRFHLRIAQMGGNPILAEMIDQCLRRQHMLECSAPNSADDLRAVKRIHREIYEALRDCDPQRARDAMRHHMKFLEANIHQMLTVAPDGRSANSTGPKRRSRAQR